MQDEIFNYLVTGGGIIAGAQLAKKYIPLKFGNLKAGAVWAFVLSLVAGALGFELSGEEWTIAAALPVLRDAGAYWLTAHGVYGAFNDKARQAKGAAIEAAVILQDIAEIDEYEEISG